MLWDQVRHYIAAVGTAAFLLLSYLLAAAGEPSNAWLWRDVLGVLS